MEAIALVRVTVMAEMTAFGELALAKLGLNLSGIATTGENLLSMVPSSSLSFVMTILMGCTSRFNAFSATDVEDLATFYSIQTELLVSVLYCKVFTTVIVYMRDAVR